MSLFLSTSLPANVASESCWMVFPVTMLSRRVWATSPFSCELVDGELQSQRQWIIAASMPRTIPVADPLSMRPCSVCPCLGAQAVAADPTREQSG